MNGAIIAIWPIALLIAAAIVGVPLWMALRHRHATPDHTDARAHYRAKQAARAPPRGVTRAHRAGRGRGWAHHRA